jgi:putative transcription antitermination factor YqgF
MKILGIDYGKRKVGFAIADGPLAEPLQVIKYSDADVLKAKIKQIIESEKIEKVVVGVSEGEMGRESENFAREIGAETFDETLSTRDAQTLSREAGINRKKRHELEDAYAAAIMLQNWLDN